MAESLKTCPHCAETIQAAAVVCRHCNRDLTTPPAATKKRSPLVTAGIVLGTLVLACALFYATGLNRVALSFLPPMEGQDARLVSTSGSPIIVAADDASFNAVAGAAQAGNVATSLRLIDQGRAFLATSGTQVRVLEVGATRTQVQVLSGEHQGKRGLVTPSFVQR